MKRLFYLGVLCLVLFEAANVYFIMPMPGSQRMRSIDVAYWLYGHRWWFRAAGLVLLLAGLWPAWRSAVGRRRWIVGGALAAAAIVAYVTNFSMAADAMFKQPSTLTMKPASSNTIDAKRLVVGIEVNGEARAYPVQLIGYHHQVRDVVGGRPVLVSYCTVCRTGRVYSPLVDGQPETFRLVGMDHFNAMFEDRTTGSWWRQANGEAIVGPRTGATLGEIASWQVTLAQWLAMHPNSLVMQPDPAFATKYAKSFDYESGASRSALTGTDTISWRDKAWVVGLTVNKASKAYDWNRLRRDRVVQDTLGGRPIVLVLAADSASFFAFMRPDTATVTLRGDSLVTLGRTYALATGRGPDGALAPIEASQEFWHSWRTFHPNTAVSVAQ